MSAKSNRDFNRRDFFKLMGVGAAGAASVGLAGCATGVQEVKKPIGRVVVVGGGYGGATVRWKWS